jgi:predicted membrane protein
MTRNLSGRLTTGGIIVVIGVVLLLSTTGIVRMQSVWGWVAALFVVIGVWGLIRSNFRNLVGPVMIIVIAGTFLLRNLGLLADSVIGTWWPLFIMLFGILIVISRSRRRQRLRVEGLDASGEVTVVSIFGSDDRRISTDEFTGAEIVAIFGDAELDLLDATSRSKSAVVEVVSVFGDVELRVPADWDVRLETLAIFGDTIDRRRRHADSDDTTAEPDLIVTGVAIFGDIQLRD